MATGPQHFREAEEYLTQATLTQDTDLASYAVAKAAVHAQLANAAAIMHGHLVGLTVGEVERTPAAQEWITALAPQQR
jgi:hypothetical protein